MDKTKIVIAVFFAALSFFAGLYFARGEADLFQSSNSMPELVTTTDVVPSDQRPISTLRDLNNALVDIAESTNQTVVTITTSRTVRMQQRSPFSFFFNDPRFDQEREFRRTGLGSGVIVSTDGYIITNNHVIDGADEILVQLYGGDELDAEIIGTDPETDIAILKVDRSNLPAIKMGDSDTIRTGEMVLAIGSPLSQDFAHTVSQGIVSASGRSSLNLNFYENYIQTDAAINPGNSGGALVNLDGELIGINTAIASRTGGYQGIGFAIPVNMARSVMESLIVDGEVRRGFLGIGLGGEVDRTMARALNLDRARGVIVGDVSEDGPAEEAGILEGDVIISLNGEEVIGWRDLQLGIASNDPGEEISIEVIRDGERMTFDVTLAERTSDEIASESPDAVDEMRENLGFSTENLTDNIRRQLNLSGSVQGVVVSDISQGSNAYRQGLRQGDVIMQVAGNTVSNTNEFYQVIRNLTNEGTEAVLLGVNRQGRNVFIAIEL